MFKVLALIAVFAVFINAQQTTCKVQHIGLAVGGFCPPGYTVISDGNCCDSQQVTSSSSAGTTTCAIASMGFAVGGFCPPGYTVISDGNCCDSQQVTLSSSAGTTCAIAPMGYAVGGMCPPGYTAISNGTCCDSKMVLMLAPPPPCVDKLNSNGFSECPGYKSYCSMLLIAQQCPKTCGFCAGNSPSTTCFDLVSPTTGRSECATNAGLCNDSRYKDLMQRQCPKTCGYCR